MKETNILKSVYTVLSVLMLLSGCTKDNDDERFSGASNNLSLGVSANDLLSAERYTSLKMEVIYVTGYEPSETSLDAIKEFLESYTHKPEGITVQTRAIASPGGGPYSISEVTKIEEDTRSEFNNGDELAVYILFVDGKSATEEDEKYILGTAYKNTSIVIFEETVKHLSETSGIARTRIETTAIKHEFGHLFGLVDNGSPAQSAHEDSENKSHCNNENCLMVATLEFSSGTLKMLEKTSAIDFDDTCRLDLQANGGK